MKKGGRLRPGRTSAIFFAVVGVVVTISACAGGSARVPSVARATTFQELASFPCPSVESPGSGDDRVMPWSIPDSIRALDGHVISLEGYLEGGMFALNDWAGGTLPKPSVGTRATSTEARSQAPPATTFGIVLQSEPFGCCVRKPPQVNETALVELPAGHEVSGAPHKIVRVTGVLRVKPEVDSGGMLVGVYRLVAHSVEEDVRPTVALPHGAEK